MKEEKHVPCAVYSRICGYFGEVRNWNLGKRQEFRDRKVFSLPHARGDEPPKLPPTPEYIEV